MKKRKITLSIRRIIMFIFVVALLISSTIFGAIVFTNWKTSAISMTNKIANDINKSIYDRVYAFMYTPFQINEIGQKIIASGMVDLSEEKQRDQFFVGVLEAQSEEIYSFSFGTIGGEYYGARRNPDGEIEIMRNNADTGGNSWYYSINEDKTANQLVVRAGQFDPRTRDWYKAAVEAGGSTFSPIYKHFVMDDLTVSASWPVYDEDGELKGVIGTHMLLSDIGKYLEQALKEYNGVALIVEKDTHKLVANSMDIPNFSVFDDGTLDHYEIKDIEDNDIQKAYSEYKKNNDMSEFFQGEDENYFVKFNEIIINGIDWIIISAVPESIYMEDIFESMSIAIIVAILFLLVSILIYNIFMKKYLSPIKDLLQMSEEFSQGDLTKRIDVVRNDEIGIIGKSFNSVADKMQTLIEDLETIVHQRTQALETTNLALQGHKDELRLILDSAAEAIYGIDINGNCTFCNASCIKLLGYNNQEDLLGENMHWKIHHSHRDGTPFAIDDCRILKSINEKKGFSADDEVFWRADGTSFDVEYFAYPQIINDKVIGAVVTFMDITDRKQKEAEIKYLNCYDTLTGLHNRRCFEENRNKVDIEDNLPLSLIFADINGLKLTNDIFGHKAGDSLIKKSSDILKQACRQNDLIARAGGDEFIILLPKTNKETAEKIVEEIRKRFLDARLEAIRCSISLGVATKTSAEDNLDEIMANAENAMYRDKTLNRKSINKDIIDTIIDSLHRKNPREKQHSIFVDELCFKMGKALNLSETEISKLRRTGYLHDIGKIVLDKEILSKPSLSEEEIEKVQQHSAVGYRILSLFDDTLDLAEYVYGHHERWDGTGYPRGLKGEQIPLISRIIAAVETYERVLNRDDSPLNERKLKALKVIREGSGTQFDPDIVEKLLSVIEKLDEEA